MQVGLSDLKILTGHQGRNKPSLTDAPYIHTLGREYTCLSLMFLKMFFVFYVLLTVCVVVFFTDI